MIRILHRWYAGVLLACAWGAAALIGGMALMISADVALRSVGWGSLPWSVEVAEYILFAATFLAAPWVLREGGHVRVDVLVRLLPTRLAGKAEQFASAIGLGVCGFLIYYGTRSTFDAYRLDALIIKQLVFPEWWLLALIPVTGVLLGIQFLLRLLDARPAEEPAAGAAPQDGF